ncbi:MAG TPA: hypothetical protein VIK53_16995 [Verrucomicrobiae bacterium]
MNRHIFNTIIKVIAFICVPAALLITVVLRRDPTYEGKTATVWTRGIRTNRDVALNALQHLGTGALPALREMLKGNSPTESCRAAWAMGRLGPTAAHAAVPDLIKSMGTGNIVLQTEVLHSLSRIRIKNEDIVPILTNKLSEDYISSYAAELLLSIEQARMVEHLPPIACDELNYDMAFAKSPVVGVRICGAYKLSMLAQTNEHARAALKSLLNDKNIAVRAETGRLMANPTALPGNFKLVSE